MAFDVKPTASRNSTDCGAACMTSFLAYYGVEKTLEEMIKECNTTVSGCTGKDLLVAGRKYGLDMTAWKELDSDDADAPEGTRVINVNILYQDRPAIVWWKYNHFVICCGVNEDGRVVLMNPSRGKYTVSKSLFKAFYSGISFCNGVPEWLPEYAPEEPKTTPKKSTKK